MVQNKYQEAHKKTRRMSRRRIVSDGVCNEYYLEVAFNNGAVETLHVSLATYKKAQPGKPKTITLRKRILWDSCNNRRNVGFGVIDIGLLAGINILARHASLP